MTKTETGKTMSRCQIISLGNATESVRQKTQHGEHDCQSENTEFRKNENRQTGMMNHDI